VGLGKGEVISSGEYQVLPLMTRSRVTRPLEFDPTSMEWSFTTQSARGKTRTIFSFSANSVAVPDGGSAVALLGVALTGIEVLRRKLKLA
jgi:hypothetical protein